MTPKALARLAGVLAALLAATVLTAWLSRPRQAPALAPGLQREAVERVGLEGPSGAVTLRREKGAWLASTPAAYPADARAVADALDKLEQATVSDALTEDPQRYPLFGLGASSATHVRIDGGRSYDFHVGKEGPDYPSVYARVAGETGVVLASGISASEWSRSPGDWLDKRISSGTPDAVTAIAVRGPKGSWRLTLSNGVWALDGKSLEPEAVERLARPAREAVGGLEADSVLDAAAAPKDTGLDKPELQVQAQVGGSALAFAVGKKDPLGRRYLRKAGELRVLFLVGDWKLDPLRKTSADFYAKPRGTR